MIRLSKLMSERGICSRREADRFISKGLVLVDGETVCELGTKVAPSAHIVLTSKAAHEQAHKRTLILNKPLGYVSCQPEDGHRAAIELIPPKYRRELAVVGRLDIDSTGLLLFTEDGRIARQIIGHDTNVEKEYLVRVEGNLSKEGLALLNHGLSLDGKPLKPAKVKWVGKRLRFILKEGKKRQIRRMCELVGLKVIALKRIRIGNIRLGNLKPGEWKIMSANDHRQ